MHPRTATLLIAMTCSLHGLAETDAKFELELRSQTRSGTAQDAFAISTRPENWPAGETAVIVCDVWDYHHCLNAVRRIEEFVPRLNQVLIEARGRGAIIIHAPSDCMDAYQSHPARQRAVAVPTATHLPADITSWCSMIPAEQLAVYPIDQSDGGEDDDPSEHRMWAEKLKSLGRNPNLPWKRQSDMIQIDPETDFISDRGDEVWNILAANGIRNVILTGVHTNMCVLGRPFGLRQMARNGLNVVLMRDMTDTMYNPRRWPYVSHHEGTRRVISHIERHVCPTISSDQFIGGKPFRFQGDDENTDFDLDPVAVPPPSNTHWSLVDLPVAKATQKHAVGPWYRCVVKIPEDWDTDDLALHHDGLAATFWCNGVKLNSDSNKTAMHGDALVAGDFNLIVMRSDAAPAVAPVMASKTRRLILAGRWQHRSGEDLALANMPLPAKFGGSADIVFSPPDPLWTARPVTQRGEFTPGIEGPACGPGGDIFAVNYAEQGTIGRVNPVGVGEVFVRLSGGSIGNGIRFPDRNSFFVADYTNHNVLRVDLATKAVTVFAHHDEMNQPNDLAIAPNGTLYASDPAWADGTGQLWQIDTSGKVTRIAQGMGTTNGIEVSPDGKTLYVNESKQRNVWAFTIGTDGGISEKRLVRKFPDHGFDGMRCDVDGNLYITRYGKGTVVKMSPDGKILREIHVLGQRPSNLCFGGTDGCTVYVTEVEATRLVSFRVDRPGRSWVEWNRVER